MDTCELKFCCNCKHLLGNRIRLDSSDNWRCHHPSNIFSATHNLVTGIPIKSLKCECLQELRSFNAMCGASGAWYELYVLPVYVPPPSAIATAISTKGVTPALKARLGALKAEDL
jgi:hypothetical protein